jgi:thioredoxin reductase
MSEVFDAVVVGAGPGGEVAVSRLAAGGLRTALVEKELIGGECGYYGCIPSKTLLRGPEAQAQAERVAGLSRPALDWPALRDYRDVMVRHHDDSRQVEEYRKNGVEVVKGSARFVGRDPWTLAVGDRVLAAEHVVLATGSQPVRPDIPGLDRVPVWTNREATSLREIPGRAALIGGGPVAVELGHFLARMGCEVTLLDPAALAAGDLSQYDAIVTGVRSHSSRPDLPANRNRLLEYVKQGGTLVVQYNRPEAGFRPGDTIGPYPFTVGNLRVSVEEAPVEFAQPDSPLLQAPNRITAADFEGWVQERGLYFASEWDQHYQAPLSSHDPGERPLAGGTLYAPYGKGAYVFTAYSWFRQLPAGVPGAYRIFANLISAGKVLQPHAATTTTASH